MKALIVIDVQNGVYAYEDTEVSAGPALIATINRLIASATAPPVVLSCSCGTRTSGSSPAHTSGS